MILINWPRLEIFRIERVGQNDRGCLPLDGLVLNFGYLIFDKRHHLTKDLVLSSLVAEEVVRILFDFVHQVVEAHETQRKVNTTRVDRKG